MPHTPLRRDIATEVLVIGAGITGSIIADALVAAGVRVVVVDKRGLARGSTAASTALVQYEIDTPLIRLTRKIGKEKAVRAWRRSRLGVETLAARLFELRVPDVARRNSLYLAGNTMGAEDLAREHEARRSAGLASRFLDRPALRNQFQIARPAALVAYGNLVIDPRKAALALLRAARGGGARIYAPTDIVDVTASANGVTVTAANGCVIRCEKLVFATGYELPIGVPRTHHKVTSTWAIATVAQERSALWPGEYCIWEASDPYIYIRTTISSRIICGGEDAECLEDERRNALIPAKTQILRRKLARLLPRIDTRFDYAWTGAFGETSNGLPIIGKVPQMPNCWIALGYGGNGTTYAAIAADVIVGEIAGRRDVDADLYAFPEGKARQGERTF